VQNSLLTTKLYFPVTRPSLVPRPLLVERLKAGLQGPLTLLSAPAGSGKTTLLSEWHAAHGSTVPVGWLSLDKDDNDPARFFLYLSTALDSLQPGISQEIQPLLQTSEKLNYEAILTLCVNSLSSAPGDCVLVLDDYHIIENPEIHQATNFLIDHLPPLLHVFLLTRADPPLPLARMRARNQMTEIRAADLRFSVEQATEFLNRVMGLALSGEQVAALEKRTEGWIAGLQLAALSMQGCKDIHGFVSAFTGSHHYIMDYLAEEVLKSQPKKVSAFLLQTSILDRLCGPLCEAVVDVDTTEPVDGQRMLETLEEMNLFTIPLDDERHWYRYHHLFADVLRKRLEHQYPQLLPGLHLRASQWYERNGFSAIAIQHSLAAGDQDRTTQLIEQNGVLLLIRGDVTTLLKWIEAVEPHSQTHPWLSVFKAWAFALTGNLDRVNGMLRTAEELISTVEPTQEVRVMQGTISAARAFQANLQGDAHTAADFARQALGYLPDIDLISRSLRTVACALLGDASSISGDLEAAKEAYTEAAKIGQAAGDIHLTIVNNSNLANVLIEQGSLRQAARIYSDTLQIATRPDGQKSIIAGRVYGELSQVFYEWNHLEDAFQYAQQCLTLCQQWGNMDLQAVGYVMLARLEHLQAHPEKVQEAMQAAEQLVNSFNFAPKYSVWVKSALARLYIMQGNPEKASRLIQQSSIDMGSMNVDAEISYLQEPIVLVLVRLLMAKGEYNAAMALNQRLLQKAEAEKRIGRVIEILVLQALAFQGKKETEKALAALERALALAQPEGYVRVFLDEAEAMTRLLCQAQSRQVGTGYVAVLLSGIEKTSGMIQPSMQLLIEPLTSREMEVLKLIEAGQSNQEIAEQLVISMPTVKRHISNIYAKLGVKSRTQAIAIGKELKLFD
jgi:LuxR family maltose regulon positive regulatory protein